MQVNEQVVVSRGRGRGWGGAYGGVGSAGRLWSGSPARLGLQGSPGLQDAHLWLGEDLGDAGTGPRGDLGSGRVHGAGFCPPVSRVLWQVGWTRTNLAKKLLEKASGVTLVLKKVPLSPPGSPLSPRQQVSNPSAPSARVGCAGNLG